MLSQLKSDWDDQIFPQMMEKTKGNRQWDTFFQCRENMMIT